MFGQQLIKPKTRIFAITFALSKRRKVRNLTLVFKNCNQSKLNSQAKILH